MRFSAALLAVFVGSAWPAASEAAEPAPSVAPAPMVSSGPPPAPPRPIPPPDQSGTGRLVWGSLTLAVGTTGVGLGLSPLYGHGPWRLISILLGAGGVVGGAVMIGYGERDHAALRRWRATSGVSARAWRRRHQPERPINTGFGLLHAGAVSLTAGAFLTGFGFDALPPLATYEPGDAPGALGVSACGVVGVVAGTAMLVMGSIEHHRFRHWTPSDDIFSGLSVYPWATQTAGGVGLAGSF